MENLLLMAELAGAITGIAACLCLICRPLRDKVLGLSAVREGQKCLLRNEMLSTYYKHHEKQEIRQYEYENFLLSYKAYKALHGNSFIDKIYKEVQAWEVIT